MKNITSIYINSIDHSTTNSTFNNKIKRKKTIMLTVRYLMKVLFFLYFE